MFKDGQSKTEGLGVVCGSGVNVTSVHADDGERCYHKRELSACMRLTPQTKNTAEK